MKVQELFESDDIEHTINKIKKECSVMLKAYQQTGSVLYRGVSKTYDDVITKNIRNDRRPIEMGIRQHDALHDAFTNLGLKSTRKNSIFCTTNKHVAEGWGEPYIIFVKDGWSGLYFTNIDRDYAFHDLSVAAQNSFEEDGTIDMSGLEKRIKKLGPVQFDTSDGLEKVIKRKVKDVLISGTSYIGINVRYFLRQDLDKRLGFDFNW